jgi:hypothetical protein
MFELGKWDYLNRSAALSQLNLKEPADRDAEIGFQKLDKMAYKE